MQHWLFAPPALTSFPGTPAYQPQIPPLHFLLLLRKKQKKKEKKIKKKKV